MRWALALAYCVLAAGSALLAQGALGNLSAGYKDSPDFTYIALGSLWVALAVAFAIAALRALRHR